MIIELFSSNIWHQHILQFNSKFHLTSFILIYFKNFLFSLRSFNRFLIDNELIFKAINTDWYIFRGLLFNDSFATKQTENRNRLIRTNW